VTDDVPEGEPIEIHSCGDVLSHVFEFLDHETDDDRRAQIAEHLEDCSSCLRQFGIEQEFKALVRRRCGGDVPPPGLRDRIKLRLTSVSFEEDGTQVSVERLTGEVVRGSTGERPTPA
jgi:mycothiol system anti-sigma-R factor